MHALEEAEVITNYYYNYFFCPSWHYTQSSAKKTIIWGSDFIRLDSLLKTFLILELKLSLNLFIERTHECNVHSY